MGRDAETSHAGNKVEIDRARRGTIYSRLVSPSQRSFLWRGWIVVLCCYGGWTTIEGGISKSFGWYYLGALELGILLLSFPVILLIRILGQVAAKKRWRLRSETIHRLINFPFALARETEMMPTEQLPNTLIRITNAKIFLHGSVSLVITVTAAGALWYFFNQPFVPGNAVLIVIAIVSLCLGVAGILGVAMRFRSRRRVALILTPTRLLLADGSWIAWDNIEDIGMFGLLPERQPMSKDRDSHESHKKDKEKHEKKYESAADWATEDKPEVWPSVPKVCGIRLVNQYPYLRTMNERQRKAVRLGRRMTLGVYAAVVISKLSALTFSGDWVDVLQNDLGVAQDALGDLPEMGEVAELTPLTWQLQYSRKRYGFDLYWGRWLDRTPSELARLMIVYKERLIVDRFLQWEEDLERRRICLKAAFPRVLNQDVFDVIALSDKPQERFARLCGLPFVAEQAESWRYDEIARTAMLRLQYAQSPRQWRVTHNLLARANAQWAAAADPYQKTWSNPYWIDHIKEEMYHLLCADPLDNLSQALNSAIRAAVTSAICARQWATMLCDAGRDAGRPELREWGQRLVNGIQGNDLTQYLTCLINDCQLDTIALTVALMKRRECHYDAGRHDEAVADFTRATRGLALYPTAFAVPEERSGGMLRQIGWASVPVWSLGILSFVPFLAFAVIRRRKRDWMIFAAYLAATLTMLGAVGSVNSNSGAHTAVRLFIIALVICAVVHAGILFRPRRRRSTPTSEGPASLRQRIQDRAREARHWIERWRQTGRVQRGR
jgi:hypothetical protein